MYNKQAFTLIELLVVVLIIGILAAVALPQYQLAVAKARITPRISLLHDIVKAEKLYYLTHGEYAADLSQLDITMPSDCFKSPGAWKSWGCGTDAMFIIGDMSGGQSNILFFRYCPGNNASGWCVDSSELQIYINMTSGQLTCHPTNNSGFGRKLCRSLSL